MKLDSKSKNRNKKKINNKKKTQKNLTQKTEKKINYKKRRIIAATIAILILLVIIVIILCKLGVFNIKKITVKNNSKILAEEIIRDSKLSVGSNMFKTLNIKIKENIKKNPYIDDVKVSKKLNGEIIITVQERQATYMLKKEDGFAYINNQGYILETTQNTLEVPCITGYATENIEPGKRLEEKDLQKLDTVKQIMEALKNKNINGLVKSIDITNENNFILELPDEGKTVEFGDKTNINMKTLWIVDIISREKGIQGTIVVNVPNIKKVYFREKV